MILIKILVAFFIFLAGINFAKRYLDKARFFEDLHIFLLSYCDLLQFCRKDILTFFEEQRGYGQNFCEFLQECKQNFLQKNVQIVFPQNIKSEEDCKQTVCRFFENIGSLDAKSELSKCEEYKTIFCKYKMDAEQEKKKNYPLIFRLSIYLAILFLILFL